MSSPNLFCLYNDMKQIYLEVSKLNFEKFMITHE